MYYKNKGFVYEIIAEKFLTDNGYEIVEKNYSCRLGEIDIIAKKNGRIRFIEVKGRKDTNFGYPREAVTLYKQKRIISAAKYYLLNKKDDDIFCQFDVIEIIANKKIINHIENAFWT